MSGLGVTGEKWELPAKNPQCCDTWFQTPTSYAHHPPTLKTHLGFQYTGKRAEMTRSWVPVCTALPTPSLERRDYWQAERAKGVFRPGKTFIFP